jgi:hypothetical protein
MDILPLYQQIATAHLVFNGAHGEVTRQARLQNVSRQRLYRQAHRVAVALDGSQQPAHLEALREQLQQAHTHREARQHQQRWQVPVPPQRQAQFACTAQAEGVSLPVSRRLLAILLGAQTPSVAQLGRWTRRAGQHAGRLLAVLDEHSRPRIREAAADEIFVNRYPILMVVEPQSLCWQTGRLARHRDGTTWAAELRPLTALEQVTRDAGTGLEKAIQQLNAERDRRGHAALADQADHFHLLREGTRALRRLQGQATRALAAAEKAQAAVARLDRRGQTKSGAATVAARQWRHAEAAFDRWSAGERAWQDLRQVLALVSPTGELNTRSRARAAVTVLLPAFSGPEWAKFVRQLRRPEVFTFLDRVGEQLAALPAAPDPAAATVRDVLVRAEGLRRRPDLLRGADAQAAAARGVLLVAAVLASLGGAAVQQLAAQVRGVFGQAWRASSLVEGLNSVLRMQQARHRRVTQELLDLKRLYWNLRAFRTGRRSGRTPYDLLGLSVHGHDWWDLLQRTPEQLREQLSAPSQAA